MKIIGSLCILVLLTSCGTSRVITSKENQQKYDNNKSQVVHSEIVNKTTEVPFPAIGKNPNTNNKVINYISQYAPIAQYEMKHSGIPASITLAQGILESGAGEGDLTQRAQNHFGIKCHGWTGEKVYHDDDKKQECFRKYNHPSESFKDHSAFLRSRSRYAPLFKLEKTDYKSWAKGLRKAGYATDPKYPSKLISLIERYDLHKYDKDVVFSSKGEEKTTEEVLVLDDLLYIVKKGDTLYSIAKQFHTTVAELKKNNELDTNTLSVGQEIKLQ